MFCNDIEKKIKCQFQVRVPTWLFFTPACIVMILMDYLQCLSGKYMAVNYIMWSVVISIVLLQFAKVNIVCYTA